MANSAEFYFRKGDFMRLLKLYIKTSKTVPSGEEAKNAQLLIKAGFVHKEMAGAYDLVLRC